MSGAQARKVTEVAVGVLLRADGAVLLADRPAGKAYAGYWEFPGGKVEAGESVADALARELREELGVTIGPSFPWVTFEFDYPHAYVRLHFERVFAWQGTPHAHEGQRLCFHRLGDEAPAPLLPAAVPALRWLGLPEVLAIADASTRLAVVAGDALHAEGARPDAEWAGAQITARDELERAARLGFDFVVAGPIRNGTERRKLGWSGFAALAKDAPLPVYAYGGIDAANLEEARRRGAHGVALVGGATSA